MADELTDKKAGISIRFVRSYTPEPFGTIHDQALVLAMHDDRDVAFIEKMNDAYEFLKSRIH